MSFNQRQFEKELKNKLSSRVTGTMTEENLFLKAFKYFDLDNSGQCSQSEFLKALVKIGVNSVNEDNINEVFNIYDKDKSGEIDYKEFVSVLFKKDQPQMKKEIKSSAEKPKQINENSKQVYISENEAIVLKIREALAKRGVGSIVSISRNFKIIDDNNNHQLEYAEFAKAAKDFQFGLTDEEVKKAFLCFDVKDSGTIDYDEFLRAVRGNMNEFRVNLVKQAFDILDINHNGMIEMEEIASKYNARLHPDVQSGRKTEEEVFQLFMNTFQDHHCILNGEEADELISLDEFIEYYQHVSMSIDDDAYFELMMNNVWRMNTNTTYKNDMKGWSNVDNTQNKGKLSDQYQQKFPNKAQTSFESTGNPLLDKFKLKLIARGARGIISLARLFKIIDDNHSKGLELDEFQKVMKDFHMDLSPKEIEDLFNLIDKNSSGIIDYEEFLRAIKGQMNQRRRNVVLKAFKSLDTDNSGEIDMSEVMGIYNAKKHPLVLSGEKSEEEILGQFLETFETHHNITKGTRNRRVNEAEFLEYYNNITMSIDNDDLFEEIIIKAWQLEGGKEPIRKAWAGELGNQKARRQMPNTTPYGIDKDKTNYGTSSNPISSNTFAEKKEEIIGKLRNCLKMRGVRGIMSIRRSFMLIDENNSKTIDFKEFSKMMHEYQMKVSDNELKVIFNYFDKDKSGEIDYEEFVSGIEGEMSNARKAIVTKAFKKIDKDNCNKISVDTIRQEFNYKQNPEVREGKKKEQEVLAEFLDLVDYHFNLLNEDKYLDGMVTLNEFIDFYRNISLGIVDDKYFEVLIISSWNLDNACPYQRGWKGENI